MLSVDLFYTMFLLHPWPNGLAAISGWFRYSVDESRDRGYILRAPPPATDMPPYKRLQELVKKQTKSLGKYRLTSDQIMALLILTQLNFTGKGHGSDYVGVVVRDLLHQPKFAEAMNMGYIVPGLYISLDPVLGFLKRKQPDLALEMIRVAGLNVGEGEFVAAFDSHDLEVLGKLCTFAEKHPQKVTFVKSLIEKYIHSYLRGDTLVGCPGVSPKELRNALQPCLNVAKP